MSMMGGTALLEELLAEQAAKDASQDASPKALDLKQLASASRGSTASSLSGVATVAPAAPTVGCQRGEVKVPPLNALQASYGEFGRIDEFNAPTSPLSREIAELTKEMDDCLGSIQQWEEDKREHRENLLSELEAQYRAEYGFVMNSEAPEHWLPACRLDVGLAGSSQPDLISPNQRQPGLLSPNPEVSSAEVSLGAADEVLARLREEDDLARAADEARISQLRAEVEDLKMRASEDSDSLVSPYAPVEAVHRLYPGTPHPGMVLDTSLSGLDSTLGLQAWRQEVDAVLGEHSLEDELRDGTLDGTSPRGIAVMEGQLAGAREHVRLLEDAVETAKACAEDELGELDQLLSECEEIHARLMGRSAEEAAGPSLTGRNHSAR